MQDESAVYSTDSKAFSSSRNAGRQRPCFLCGVCMKYDGAGDAYHFNVELWLESILCTKVAKCTRNTLTLRWAAGVCRDVSVKRGAPQLLRRRPQEFPGMVTPFYRDLRISSSLRFRFLESLFDVSLYRKLFSYFGKVLSLAKHNKRLLRQAHSIAHL